MKTVLSIFCLVELLFVMKYKMDSIHYRSAAEMWEANSRENAADLVGKEERLTSCEDDNYTIHERVKYVEGQNEYMIDRCQAIYKRLRETSSILESVEYCSNHKLTPDKCGVTRDLKYFLNENRKANF